MSDWSTAFRTTTYLQPRATSDTSERRRSGQPGV